MKFRKKPVVIEAIQWTGVNADMILGFTLGRASVRPVLRHPHEVRVLAFRRLPLPEHRPDRNPPDRHEIMRPDSPEEV